LPGLDVININYRGLAGAKLTTSKMYCCASTQDVKEPLISMHERFCKNSDQKSFLIGFSMGANVLTNAIGEIDSEHKGALYDGACIIQCPMRIWIGYKTLSTSLFGFYNYALCSKFVSLYIEHEE
jgi:predicted alpha/beta-fold hydrolase